VTGDFRFTFRTRADFSDTDVTGVVYYGRYAALMDRGVVEYRRHVGLDNLGPDGHRYLVRAATFAYRDSLRFDDLIDIHVRIAEIGRTSHRYEVAVDRIDESGNVRCADCSLTIVGVDGYGSEARATPVPELLRDSINAFEGRL
jgi:acyl-CoA thioester hydrolase